MKRRASWLRRRLRERAGVAAIEFALIAPVMLTFLFSTVELTNVFRVQAKLNTAAGQLAEMVAGQSSITAPGGSLADLCTGAAMNIIPYDRGRFSANIASVTNDHPRNRVNGSTDSTSVGTYLDWESVSSCAAGASGSLGLGGAFNLANTPRSLLTKSGDPAAGAGDQALQFGYSAIVVKARYQYTNVVPFMLGASLTFSATAVARPRTNTKIQCTNNAGSTICPQLQ